MFQSSYWHKSIKNQNGNGKIYIEPIGKKSITFQSVIRMPEWMNLS